ncbi:MAG TPA: TIGR02300 family protein, partial [Xanthobacteraceae bacterium]|nr:TIGR02300 family protein [Xanthobacteraceae bacterium]
MAKPELGTKRLCGSCAAKFYDLSKTPIVCPKCNTVLELAAVTSRGRPDGAGARAAAVASEE